MMSPASPPGPALGPALREGLKPGPGPSPTFKARAQPGLVFLGPDPSLSKIMDEFELYPSLLLSIPHFSAHYELYGSHIVLSRIRIGRDLQVILFS